MSYSRPDSRENSPYEGWDTDSHRREFDGWNAQADSHFRFAYGAFAEQRYLRTAVERLERPSILDVGCATGTTYRYLKLTSAARPFDYQGVDLSAPAIARARELYPQADFRQKELEPLMDFTGRKYDIVFSRDTVLHQIDPYGFLTQLLDVAGRYLVLRLRTRDVGDTVLDIEQSCQMHYDRYWMPYIVLNTDELIDRLKAFPNVSRIVMNRSYEVLGGQNYRYLPKELYLSKTGGSETSLLIELGSRSAAGAAVVMERQLEGQAFLRHNRYRRYLFALWSRIVRPHR